MGGAGNDIINGNPAANNLWGGAGHDVLRGGAGHDRLLGGDGADILIGGDGDDAYVFSNGEESPAGAADRIAGFTVGEDLIDLGAIDARAGAGDEAFAWLGNGRFTGAGGELRFIVTPSGVRVLADIDGDREVDMAITVAGLAGLTVDVFIL